MFASRRVGRTSLVVAAAVTTLMSAQAAGIPPPGEVVSPLGEVVSAPTVFPDRRTDPAGSIRLDRPNVRTQASLRERGHGH
jgi:hypothetical protein